MANAQPFYHRAVVLFTVKDREVSLSELTEAIKALKIHGLIKASVLVEECDGEPGDPADLVS